MTDPVITMTLKEAQELDAELQALKAELATAKTAAEKSPAISKIAEEISKVLLENKLISVEKQAETKANLEKEGGLALYFKKACDLYRSAKTAAQKTETTPARIGKTAEKVAEDKPQSSLEAASERFAQRVLSAGK